MDISDQELQKQLQQLMRQQQQQPKSQQTLDRQFQLLEAQVEAQMAQEKALRQAARQAKRLASPSPAAQPQPPASTRKYVTDLLGYLAASFPAFLDSVLKGLGYSKMAPMKKLEAAPRKKVATTPPPIVRSMDKDFREIKEMTQLLLVSPKAGKKSLQNTSSVLTTILKTAPPRYRTELQSLKKRVARKLESL